MDFGDILDQWDSIKANTPRSTNGGAKTQGKQASRKKPNIPMNSMHCAPSLLRSKEGKHSLDKPASAPSPDVRAMQEEWICQHITFDKDASADEETKRAAEHSVRYIKSMPPDARLDLHGYTQREAWSRLSDFIDECIRRGARKVLIIHGKGIHASDSEGVLSGLVQDFIEADSRLGQSGHPDRKHGGRGATWVLIKR